MATPVWQTNNGDMSDVASWSTASLPGNDDIALLDGTSQRSAIAGLTFAATQPSFVTTRNFLGDIGQPGNPLILNGNADVEHHFQGLGTVYLGNGTNASEYVVVDSLNFRDALLTEGAIGALFVKSGRVIVAAGGTFTGGSAGTHLSIDGELAHVVIEQSAAADRMPAIVRCVSGLLECKRDFEASTDALTVSGGTVVMTGLLKSTMVVTVSAGVLEYAPETDPTSDAPFFLIDGGVLDISKSKFAIPVSAVHVGRGGKVVTSETNPSATFVSVELKSKQPIKVP